MAYFGVSYVVIAKLNEDTGKYTDGVVLGMCGTSVTPNYVESSLDVDDKVGHYKKTFQDADVSVDVAEIPLKVGEMLFGHKFDQASNTQTSNVDDVESYVGYGFVGSEEAANGTVHYTSCWLPKVKFSEAAEDLKTKGKNLQLVSQKLTGKALANDAGDWRIKQQHPTKKEGLDLLKQKAAITPVAV